MDIRKTTPEVPPKSRQQTMLRDALEVILLVAVIFFAIKLSIEMRPVSGNSMVPNLQDQQSLFVNKLAYIFGNPQRGDVIIFYYPRDTQEVFVKRVIGLPGDTVVIGPTTVVVNGVQLQETYISAADNCTVLGGQPCTKQTIKLGPNQFWVMGDNRPISEDSRVWGVLDRKYIIGKAAFVWWPLTAFHSIDTHAAVFAHVPSASVPFSAGTGLATLALMPLPAVALLRHRKRPLR